MLLEFWDYFCLGSKNRYDHRLRFILLWQFHRAMESLVRVHSNRLVSHKYACIYTCKYIYIHTMVYIYIIYIYIHNNNNNTYIFDCVYICVWYTYWVCLEDLCKKKSVCPGAVRATADWAQSRPQWILETWGFDHGLMVV